MDKETSIKLTKILENGFNLKFIKDLRKFLKLLKEYDVPIKQVYNYAEAVHKQHMKLVSSNILAIRNERKKIEAMPKCPECGHHPYMLLFVSNGEVNKNNLNGYTYVYYCDNCIHEEFFKDKQYQEELDRIVMLKEKNNV